MPGTRDVRLGAESLIFLSFLFTQLSPRPILHLGALCDEDLTGCKLFTFTLTGQ